MRVFGWFLVVVEVLLVACVVVATVTQGWAAAGPAAGLVMWTFVLVVLWPDVWQT